MHGHGIRRICTRDTDFNQFTFLEIIDPLRAACIVHTTGSPKSIAALQRAIGIARCGTFNLKLIISSNLAERSQIHQSSQQRWSIAHPVKVKGQPVRLVVQVPVNASFSTNVRIQTGDADAGIAAPFRTLHAERLLRGLRHQGRCAEKIPHGGHDVSVPLSFNGFNQAFDALLKE